MKPRLLDLFCGAGGAAMGYHRAGFDVVGVDNRPQPNYPFEFIQGDALEFLGDWNNWLFEGRPGDSRLAFDAIHASPPCQAHVKGLNAVNRSLGRTVEHLDLIGATRELLQQAAIPWVIENVVGSPLESPTRLCGSSFGLNVRRHRLFETSFPLLIPPCAHGTQNGDYYTTRHVDGRLARSKVVQVYGNVGRSSREHWAEAMGVDWMTADELREAIPPAYTELIGHQLLAHLNAVAA